MQQTYPFSHRMTRAGMPSKSLNCASSGTFLARSPAPATRWDRAVVRAVMRCLSVSAVLFNGNFSR